MSDLKWRQFFSRSCALGIVMSVLSRSERCSVFEHIHLHLSHVQLLKAFQNRELDLHQVELSLHRLVFIVLERVEVSFDLFLQLVLGNLCISIFHWTRQHHHWIVLCCWLVVVLLFLVFEISRLHLLLVSLVELFPLFALVLLHHLVVLHQFQVLEIVGVRSLDAFFSFVHDPEECLSFIERNHEELDMLSVDVLEFFVGWEDVLAFDLFDEFFEAFYCLEEVLLIGINVIFISNTLLFELVELVDKVTVFFIRFGNLIN